MCYFLSFKLSFIDPQIKTPTLLLLGADDIRVPPKQGTNFHRLLKAKGVETRLVRNGMYRSMMAGTKSEKKPNQIDDFPNTRGGCLFVLYLDASSRQIKEIEDYS